MKMKCIAVMILVFCLGYSNGANKRPRNEYVQKTPVGIVQPEAEDVYQQLTLLWYLGMKVDFDSWDQESDLKQGHKFASSLILDRSIEAFRDGFVWDNADLFRVAVEMCRICALWAYAPIASPELTWFQYFVSKIVDLWAVGEKNLAQTSDLLASAFDAYDQKRFNSQMQALLPLLVSVNKKLLFRMFQATCLFRMAPKNKIFLTTGIFTPEVVKIFQKTDELIRRKSEKIIFDGDVGYSLNDERAKELFDLLYDSLAQDIRRVLKSE